MDFVFTDMTLNFLAVTLLAASVSLFGLYGIWAGPRQSLKYAFAGMGISMFLMSLTSLGEGLFYQKWSYICLSLQTAFLVPLGMFLIWFAYYFPKRLEVNKWEIRISLLACLAIECHELYWCVRRIHGGLTKGMVEWRPVYADYLIVVVLAWAVIVFLRQSARTSPDSPNRSVLLRVLAPLQQSEKRARNMAFLFLVPVMITGLPTDHPIMSGIILLTLGTFVILYLNEAPEKTSFMVKLVGIFLCLSLLLVTTCGGLILRNDRDVLVQDRSYSGRGGALLVPENQTLTFNPRTHNKGYFLSTKPLNWENEIGKKHNVSHSRERRMDLPFSVPYFGVEHQKIIVSIDGYISLGDSIDSRIFRFQYGNQPMIIPALMEIDVHSLGEHGGLFTQVTEDKAIISWINVASLRNDKLRHSFQVVLHRGGMIEMNYGEMESSNILYRDTHYPMDIHLYGLLPGGESPKPHRVHHSTLRQSNRAIVRPHGLVHDQTLMLLQAGLPHGYIFSIALICVFVIILAGLPIFFHQTLIRPLHALLRGVDQVNNGRLDTKVPVFFMDEIGYLARSFNRMVAFVNRSTEELKSYHNMLEERVHERTKALEIAKGEAERASAAKSIFLANMSHELRTPLHPIIGFSQLVADSDNLTKDQNESLKVIHTSGNHLLSLINNILQISKAEAGKVTVVESEFDLRSLLNDLKGMLSMQESKGEIPLHWSIPEDLPPRFFGDPGKIKQILSNLVGNALKFTHEGKISIDLKWEFSMDTKSDKERMRSTTLQFTVADTGEGIPKKDMDDLYKPFFQTGSGLQSQKGAGLGLSICKHYVDLLNGELWIKSEFGVGTQANFKLPLFALVGADPESVEDSLKIETVGASSQSKNTRILVAEDDPINAKLLKAMLAPCGYDLKIVSNGLIAVEAAQKWKPHLIWMDIRMPVMGGREAAQQIRSLSSAEQWSIRPVIIALTADVQQSERSQFTLSGFDHVMIKPCSKKDLIAAIKFYVTKKVENNEPSDKS
jgi:signal transduction histidine kinase/CheY-like chemotaxis protein